MTHSGIHREERLGSGSPGSANPRVFCLPISATDGSSPVGPEGWFSSFSLFTRNCSEHLGGYLPSVLVIQPERW